MPSLSDIHAELIEMSKKYPYGFGYDEFKQENPSPELYFYVKKIGWDTTLDIMFPPNQNPEIWT